MKYVITYYTYFEKIKPPKHQPVLFAIHGYDSYGLWFILLGLTRSLAIPCLHCRQRTLDGNTALTENHFA